MWQPFMILLDTGTKIRKQNYKLTEVGVSAPREVSLVVVGSEEKEDGESCSLNKLSADMVIKISIELWKKSKKKIYCFTT